VVRAIAELGESPPQETDVGKRLVNRGRGWCWMCGTGGLLKPGQGKSPVASCGEAIRSAG